MRWGAPQLPTQAPKTLCRGQNGIFWPFWGKKCGFLVMAAPKQSITCSKTLQNTFFGVRHPQNHTQNHSVWCGLPSCLSWHGCARPSRQRLCGVGSRSTRRPHRALPGALAWPVVPAAPPALEGHNMVAEARHLPPGKYRGERRMQKDAEGGCAGAGQEQLQHFTLTNEFMYHRFY